MTEAKVLFCFITCPWQNFQWVCHLLQILEQKACSCFHSKDSQVHKDYKFLLSQNGHKGIWNIHEEEKKDIYIYISSFPIRKGRQEQDHSKAGKQNRDTLWDRERNRAQTGTSLVCGHKLLFLEWFWIYSDIRKGIPQRPRKEMC